MLDQHIHYNNQNNFINFGLWFWRKLRALFEKKEDAKTKIKNSGFSELALNLEWTRQKYDAIQQAPSKS